MPKDYAKTLNLPKTDFSMRANLPTREPVTQEKWEKENIYGEMLKKNEGQTALCCMTALLFPTAISTWVRP